MTNEQRQQIADLCRAHDEFMFEAREWLRRPLVSESDDAGLIFKDYHDDAFQPAPEPEPDALFGDARDDLLARAIGYALARKERANERAAEAGERAAELAKLQTEIDELRGQVNTLTCLLRDGPKSKAAAVIDLPRFMRKRTD